MSLQKLPDYVSHRHCAQRRSETLKVNQYVKNRSKSHCLLPGAPSRPSKRLPLCSSPGRCCLLGRSGAGAAGDYLEEN